MISVAVDVGGTFTDVCVLDDESGDIQVAKVPSTKDPLRADEPSWQRPDLGGVQAAQS